MSYKDTRVGCEEGFISSEDDLATPDLPEEDAADEGFELPFPDI